MLSKILSIFHCFFDLQKIRNIGPVGLPREPQNQPKLLFFTSFFQTLFFYRFCTHFWVLRPLKIVLPCRRQHDFHKIAFFKNCQILPPFWYHFGRLFGARDGSEKQSIFCQRFDTNVEQFGAILEPKRGPKMEP